MRFFFLFRCFKCAAPSAAPSCLPFPLQSLGPSFQTIQLCSAVYRWDGVNGCTDPQFTACKQNNGAEGDSARYASLSDLLFK